MKDLKTNLLRHHQRQELQTEIDGFNQAMPHAKGEDIGILQRRKKQTEKQLWSQSPEPLTGAEKDKLKALERRLRDRITENMPTEEVMRKNPVGAVDWHTRWSKATKPLVRMWKNARIQLNPDSEDRDLANIERYRPSGQMDRMRSDAQIPGMMTYGTIDDEQWPFPKPENTALDQAKRVYEESEAESDVNKALDVFDTEEVSQEDPAGEGTGYGPKGKLTLEQYTEVTERLAQARAVRKKKIEDERQLDEQMAKVDDVAETE